MAPTDPAQRENRFTVRAIGSPTQQMWMALPMSVRCQENGRGPMAERRITGRADRFMAPKLWAGRRVVAHKRPGRSRFQGPLGPRFFRTGGPQITQMTRRGWRHEPTPPPDL